MDEVSHARQLGGVVLLFVLHDGLAQADRKTSPVVRTG